MMIVYLRRETSLSLFMVLFWFFFAVFWCIPPGPQQTICAFGITTELPSSARTHVVVLPLLREDFQSLWTNPFSYGSRPRLMQLQASKRRNGQEDQVLGNSTFMFWLYFDMYWVYRIAFLPSSIVLNQAASWLDEILNYLYYDCNLWFDWVVAQHGCVLGPCLMALEQHPPMLGLARRGLGINYIPCNFVVPHHGMSEPCIMVLSARIHEVVLPITWPAITVLFIVNFITLCWSILSTSCWQIYVFSDHLFCIKGHHAHGLLLVQFPFRRSENGLLNCSDYS